MVSLNCPLYWTIAMSTLMLRKASVVPGTESPLSCTEISQKMDLSSEAEGS